MSYHKKVVDQFFPELLVTKYDPSQEPNSVFLFLLQTIYPGLPTHAYTVCPGSAWTVFIKNTGHELISKFHSFYSK
jgi:hypothetical protein